jgi:hypothetical protein
MAAIHDDSGMMDTISEEEKANCCSMLLYSWLSPLFVLASQKTQEHSVINQEDLCSLPSKDHSENLSKTFQNAWDKYSILAKEKFQLEKGFTLHSNTSHMNDIDNQPLEPSTTCCSNFVRCFCCFCSNVFFCAKCCSSKKDRETAQKKQSRAKAARMWIFKKASFAVLGPQVYRTAGIVKFFNSTSQFAFPICLSGIVAYIQGEYNNHPHSIYIGLSLCFALFIAMCSKAILENRYFHLVVRGGFQLRSALSTAVYSKSLRLTAASRQTKTLGEIVNLMQIDATKIEGFTTQLHVIWDGAYQITGYVSILLFFIGWPALVGVVFMIVAMPVQKNIMMKQYMRNRAMVKDTDSRVKITNELLQGIQCVKMYSWEESFFNVIEKFRQKELESLKKIAYLIAFSRAYMYMVMKSFMIV